MVALPPQSFSLHFGLAYLICQLIFISTVPYLQTCCESVHLLLSGDSLVTLDPFMIKSTHSGVHAIH